MSFDLSSNEIYTEEYPFTSIQNLFTLHLNDSKWNLKHKKLNEPNKEIVYIRNSRLYG